MLNVMLIFAALIGRLLFKDMVLNSLFIDWDINKFFLQKTIVERGIYYKITLLICESQAGFIVIIMRRRR